MLRTKDTQKLFRNILRAMPAMPFFAPKKTSIVPIVLGAIGAALVGGVAAVMIFSPRTRYRALDIAKDGIGKVKHQVDQFGWAQKIGLASGERERTTLEEHPYNGLATEGSAVSYADRGT